jgi:hypothetical protein
MKYVPKDALLASYDETIADTFSMLEDTDHLLQVKPILERLINELAIDIDPLDKVRQLRAWAKSGLDSYVDRRGDYGEQARDDFNDFLEKIDSLFPNAEVAG